MEAHGKVWKGMMLEYQYTVKFLSSKILLCSVWEYTVVDIGGDNVRGDKEESLEDNGIMGIMVPWGF